MARSTLRHKRFGPETANCEFVFERNGQKRRVRARVGKPYRESARGWACPVEIRGLERRYPDMRGDDSLQALCLATSLLRARFEAFIEDGGRILDVDDSSEWSVDEVMATFGSKRPSTNDAVPLPAEDPQFLNIDVDIRSRYPLTALIAALPWSRQPRNAENQPDPHWVVLNPPGITHTAEGAARKLLAHIRGLRGEARRCWRRARLRVFDIGVQAGGAGRAFEDVGLTAETLRQIALVGAQIKVTVYPARPTSSQPFADADPTGSALVRRKRQPGWTARSRGLRR